MYRFLICCIILVNVNACFAQVYNFVQNKPYYKSAGYYQTQIMPSDLTALERYSMHRTYRSENPIQRLERLENLAFGAVQEGSPSVRYKNVEEAILARPQNNFKRTALSSIANYLTGQPTGYTPPINNNFMPSFFDDRTMNMRRMTQYQNGIFGSGYNFINSGYGSGGSVKIFD